MLKAKYLILILLSSFFLFLIKPMEAVEAQVCYPETRVIDLYECLAPRQDGVTGNYYCPGSQNLNDQRTMACTYGAYVDSQCTTAGVCSSDDTCNLSTAYLPCPTNWTKCKNTNDQVACAEGTISQCAVSYSCKCSNTPALCDTLLPGEEPPPPGEEPPPGDQPPPVTGGGSCNWDPNSPPGCVGENGGLTYTGGGRGTCTSDSYTPGAPCEYPSHCRTNGSQTWQDWWCYIPNNNQCCSGLEIVGTQCLCPTPNPSCSISLTPNPANMGLNQTATMVVNIVSQVNGSINRVDFVSGNTNIVTVTTPDNNYLYTTNATARNAGSTTVTATARIQGNGKTATCASGAVVNVAPPGAWWQIVGGGATTNGSLISQIPIVEDFILDGLGGFPGVGIYGGVIYDFSAGSGQGSVSSTGWLANSLYLGKYYSYSYFDALLASSGETVSAIASGSINASDLTSGGVESGGYYWYKSDGSLTINGSGVLGGTRKVVLFVNGDLTINGNLTTALPGDNFFMAIVGGNIYIDSLVTSLDGLYFADGSIQTGAGTGQLVVEGSMVTQGGSLYFQRDLGTANSTTPAELFGFSPPIVASYPPQLSQTRVFWREVAP